jgi:hypothetical protein
MLRSNRIWKCFLLTSLLVLSPTSVLGKEPKEVWKQFRETYPFHYQTLERECLSCPNHLLV